MLRVIRNSGEIIGTNLYSHSEEERQSTAIESCNNLLGLFFDGPTVINVEHCCGMLWSAKCGGICSKIVIRYCMCEKITHCISLVFDCV